MTNKNFGAADIVVFVGMLMISVCVGIYYAVKDRKEKNVKNYYFGGRKMSPIPVGLSISVTFISAITVIGFPAESYFYGMILIWFAWLCVLPYIIACFYYIPIIHRLKLTSVFQYLEYRFHKTMRQAASVIAIITLIFYMGITIYVPGLALSAVTPLNLTWTILLTSVVCTFYTTLGGMKAVIWTDAIQTLAMVAGALAALIKTVIVVGGFQEIWPALERGGRLNIFTMDADPTIRYTFWTFFIGNVIGSCRLTCVNQAISQRYLSCKTANKARIAALVAVIPTGLLMTTAVLTGGAMYKYYEGCDPLKNGQIHKPDQMVPYLVVDIFRDTPGMAGLFLAAGFSGTMSTVSSGINSVAALLLEDFIVPRKPKMSEVFRVTISKFIVFGLGVVVMCVAYLESNLDATIVRVLLSITSTLEGPLLGVFTLGLLFPWSTTKGAAAGQVVGTAITAWITIGSFLYGKHANQHLPVSTAECPVSTTTTSLHNATYFSSTSGGLAALSNTTYPSDVDHSMLLSNATTAVGSALESAWNDPTMSTAILSPSTHLHSDPEPAINSTLYAISYLYLAVVSVIVTVTVGLIVSFLTGATKSKDADPRLFEPLFDNECLPECVRKFFRFGVPPIPPESEDEEKKPIESEESSQSDQGEQYKLLLEAKESVL